MSNLADLQFADSNFSADLKLQHVRKYIICLLVLRQSCAAFCNDLRIDHEHLRICDFRTGTPEEMMIVIILHYYFKTQNSFLNIHAAY